MPLSAAQLTLIKNDIAASGDLNAHPNTSDGNDAIARAYNQTAAPDFWVWRTGVSKDELTNATGPEGTTFTWAGNGFITRSAGEQAAWRELFSINGMVNPALPQVRQAFQDIFNGTGNAASNRAHMNAVARRKATRLEKVLATGTGSTASPATMGYEGPVNYDQVTAARNS